MDIPYCAIANSGTDQNNLKETLIRNGTNLRHIKITSYYGNDYLMALLICRSLNLTVLDMSNARARLVNTIIGGLPENNNIQSLNISAVGNHNPNTPWEDSLQFDTIKNMVDKCRKLIWAENH